MQGLTNFFNSMINMAVEPFKDNRVALILSSFDEVITTGTIPYLLEDHLLFEFEKILPNEIRDFNIFT